MSVEVRYYSDPACIWSWAAEPALRRLMWEFEGELSFVWGMGGLARHFGSAYRDSEARVGNGPDCFADLMAHWLNVAGRTGMPCDPRLWTDDPISSSFPACVAVEAASEQGWEAGYRYLRRIREGILCFRRKLDEPAALIAEAAPAGLDVDAFEAALDSTAPMAAFEAHLEEVREVPQEARDLGKTSVTEGHERLSFPSAIFIGADGVRHGVYGAQPARAYRDAARAAGARPANDGELPPLEAVARFGRLAVPEVDLLARTEPIETRAELWRLAVEHRLHPVPALTGTLWELA
ncbi:MAG: DsbA family protein [Actinobacteria bacterium]|nr:DsbA family protein [Actinomycetota bacterium]